MHEMPTRKQIAAAQANELIRLMGFNRDYHSLRITTLRQTLESFAEIFRETKAHTNQCDLTLFEGLFATLCDEARRIELIEEMSSADAELFAKALHATAEAALERQGRAA